MYHKIAFCLISWLTVLACPLRLSAWQPPVTLPHLTYHFHKITQTEGLSSYYVKKIIQDSYGYTWIATQDGLNRYDGRNISIYNHLSETSRRLVNNDIWDLAEDTTSHHLWVLTYNGLNTIDLSNGQVLPSRPAQSMLLRHFPKSWFKCLQLCGRRLWIGTHNGLAVYDVGRDSLVSIDQLALPAAQPGHHGDDPDIDRFWQDELHRVWVFVANYGIVIYSAEGHILQCHTLAELGLPKDKDEYRFRSVCRLKNGCLAAVTNTGFFQITYTGATFHWTSFSLPGTTTPFGHQEFYSCTTDARGILWLGGGGSLYRIDVPDKKVSLIRDADYPDPENWFSTIYSIYFDAYHHLWLGTQKGVAFSTITVSPFAAYFLSADYSSTINHANYAFPENDTVIDVCAEDGFYRVNPHTHLIHKLASGEFWYTTRLQNHDLLVSQDSQLYILRGQRLVRAESLYPELKPIHKEAIIGLVYCGDSLAIMGSDHGHGVFCWYTQKHSLSVLNDSIGPPVLASGIVNGLYHDHRGRVWILSDQFYTLYDPASGHADTFHVADPYTHHPATFYFDVTEMQGCYWLALYGTGLLGLDSNGKTRHVYSIPQGMANSGAYKVFPWHDSLLFVTSNNGMSRIRLRDSSIANYFQSDGLHGNGFEESFGYVDRQYIYSGGERGVSRIDPALIQPDPSPPALRIGNVRFETPSATYAIGDLQTSSLTVPSEIVRATLTVFTFNYTDQNRTQVSYRIPELKTAWIPLGDERTIDLQGLSPREYTLLVRAVNSNSPLALRRLTLYIHWLPKWYQTLWFKLLICAIVILLFYAFYRYRIQQLRKQQQIRQSISSDLHDDIGSSLNTIRIFTLLARKGPEAETWLSQIETSLTDTTIALRDMIWVLDDSQDTVFELLDRIRQFAIPITAAHGVRLEVTTDGPSLHLDKDEKRNLLLVTKEAVNNSIKYAACTRISIRVVTSSRALSLHIEDDGVGFNSLQTTQGNGLRNIARRAKRMHYTSAIDSKPGAGTRITLSRR